MIIRGLFISVVLMFTLNANANIYDDYHRDYQELDTNIKAAAQGNQSAPMLTNKRYFALINQLTNDKQLQKFLDPTQQDISLINNICSLSNSMTKNYIMFNFHTDGSSNLVNIKENMQKYQNEILAFTRFTIKCLAGVIPKLDNFYHNLPEVEKTEPRKQALSTMRVGIMQLYIGYLAQLNSDYFTTHSKQIMLSILVETTPNFVSIMNLATRHQIRNFIEISLLETDEPYQAGLKKIIVQLKSETCEELCAID